MITAGMAGSEVPREILGQACGTQEETAQIAGNAWVIDAGGIPDIAGRRGNRIGVMGTVDDSLAALSEPDRGCLHRVIDIARAMVPEAVEGMSYGMPALKFEGKPLIGVVAAAKHLSVFPFSPAVIDAVAGRLEGYSLSKGTIRFTPDHPLPDDVLEEIVRLRRAEILK
jgi:uncharacterized protein YdhG (YjbR/CyaY superfamily)